MLVGQGRRIRVLSIDWRVWCIAIDVMGIFKLLHEVRLAFGSIALVLRVDVYLFMISVVRAGRNGVHIEQEPRTRLGSLPCSAAAARVLQAFETLQCGLRPCNKARC